jgi:mono/diheme cytochrome c family protein
MLGAVRSTRQCVACHGGDRGDLLGAFSYALVSDGP